MYLLYLFVTEYLNFVIKAELLDSLYELQKLMVLISDLPLYMDMFHYGQEFNTSTAQEKLFRYSMDI